MKCVLGLDALVLLDQPLHDERGAHARRNGRARGLQNLLVWAGLRNVDAELGRGCNTGGVHCVLLWRVKILREKMPFNFIKSQKFGAKRCVRSMYIPFHSAIRLGRFHTGTPSSSKLA